MKKTDLAKLNSVMTGMLSENSQRELETIFAKGDITAIGSKIIETSAVIDAMSRWSVRRGERPAALLRSCDACHMISLRKVYCFIKEIFYLFLMKLHFLFLQLFKDKF